MKFCNNIFEKNIYDKNESHRKCSIFVILFFVLFLVCVLSGCVDSDNPVLATQDIIGEIAATETVDPETSSTPVPTEGQSIVIEPSASINSNDRVIDFTDPYLESVIRDLLGKSIGDIYLSDVQSITSLTARVKGIRSINDLAYFTSLEVLDLYGNKISDISALGSLTNLRVLNIGKNYHALYSNDTVSGLNLSPLSSLALLEELYIEDNGIADITPLSDLTQLKVLNVSNNSITDIASVSSMVLLENLNVSYNKITDISAVASCSKLVCLDASYNYYELMNDTNFYTGYGIKDISALEKLTELTYVNISMNMVNSVEPLSKLPELKEIYADDNYITNIDCFKENGSIEVLSVKRNYISDFGVILKMDALEELDYIGNPVAETEAIDKFETESNIR